VDVVVPFAGTAAALADVVARVGALARRDGDTLTVVVNRPGLARGAAGAGAGVEVVEAAAVRSSYHARNAGARRGRAPWLLFLDADVEAPADLLDRLFAPPPAGRTAVLAGGVRDLPGPGPAARYAEQTGAMSQEVTLGHGRWAFAQTACCAVRRSAFEQVGGFREVRSGGDADLGFRLRAAGWELERREHAAVGHRGRGSVAALLGQRARHGAGIAWLNREHPGSFPPRSLPGTVRFAARRSRTALGARRAGDDDAALRAALDGATLVAFELGRRVLPNRVRRG
jgi:GT2 family glycosyltransferase